MPRHKNYDLQHLKEGLKPDIIEAITEAFDEGSEEGFSRGEKILQKRSEEAAKRVVKTVQKATDKNPATISPEVTVDTKTAKLQKQLAVDLQKIVSKEPVELEIDLYAITRSKNFEKNGKKAIQNFVATYAAYLEKTGKELDQYKTLFSGLTNPEGYVDGNGKIDATGKHTLELYGYLIQEVKKLNAELIGTVKLQEKVESSTAKTKSKSTPDKNPVLSGAEDAAPVVKAQEQIQEELRKTREEAEKTEAALEQAVLSDEEYEIANKNRLERIKGIANKAYHKFRPEDFATKSEEYQIRTTSASGGSWVSETFKTLKEAQDALKKYPTDFGETHNVEKIDAARMSIEQYNEATEKARIANERLIASERELANTRREVATQPDQSSVLSGDAKPIQETTTAINEQTSAVDNLRKMYDELRAAYDALPKQKTEQPEDYLYDYSKAKKYTDFTYDGEDRLSTSPVADYDTWEKAYTERLASIREAIQLTYKKIREMQTAVDKHGGHLGDEIYDEKDIEEAKHGLMGLFEMYAANDGNLDSLDVKMTKPFKAMIETVKEAIAVNAAQKEKYDAETQEIIANNLEQIKSFDKLHDATRRAFEAAKSPDKEYQYRVPNLPDISTGFDFDDYYAFDHYDSFEYICSYLGIEIPQAAEKAKQAIKEVANVSSQETNQTPLSSDDKRADNAEESAKEIEAADEKIEASNEEVEQSEEKLENTTKKSRKKSSSAAKEQADEVEKAKDRIVAANKEAAQSESNPLNTESSSQGMKEEATAADKVAKSMTEASKAKEKFADANKMVENSANASAPAIQKEADAADEISEIEPFSEEWDNALKTAEEYLSILGEVYNITRKIRTDKKGRRLISYQFAGETGNSITVGHNGDLISSTQKLDTSLDDTKKATAQNEKAAQAYDNLVAKAKEYYTLIGKEKASQNVNSGIEFGVKEQNRLSELRQEFENAAQGVGVFERAIQGSEESLKRYDAAQSKYMQDSKQMYVDSLKADANKSFEKFEVTTANKRALQYVEQYNNAVVELSNKIKELNNKTEQGIDVITEDELSDIARLQSEIEQLQKTLRLMKNNKEFQLADKTEAYRQIAGISQTLDKHSNMPNDLKEQFKEVRQKYQIVIETGDSQKRLEELNAETAKLNSQLMASGKTGRSFFDTVGQKVRHLSAQFIAMYFSLYDIINVVRQGFETIKKYDTALTEMNKVSDESIDTLKEFQKESFALADAIGTTAEVIQNSTADWMRLGESIEEAKKSAQATSILLNVSEFDSIDAATESLVAMSQAYKDLEKMDIVDIMNNIGNNYSISTDELATALQKSASALTTAGNDINEAVAIITAGNAIVQDADSVGTGLQTIALRLTGTESAKEELEDLGEETDNVVTSISKLRDTIKTATAVESNDFQGFDILDDNGNYKSTYEILLGLSEVYDEIAETDKKFGNNNLNLLLETIAGKRRANIAASILQNNDLLESVYESSKNSSGSALKENEAYLESIQGHLDQLKNAWENLWVNENNREVITMFLDLATTILKVVENVGVLNTAIAGLGVGLGIYAKKKTGSGRVKMLTLKVYEYATGEFNSDVCELCVA